MEHLVAHVNLAVYMDLSLSGHDCPWYVPLDNSWCNFLWFLFNNPLQLLFVILTSPFQNFLQNFSSIIAYTPDTSQGSLTYTLWNECAAASTGLAAIGMMARAIKHTLSKEGPGNAGMILIDVLARVGLTLGMIWASEPVLSFIFQECSWLGQTFFNGFRQAGGDPNWMSLINEQLFGGAIAEIIIFFMLLYVALMLAAAKLLMLFCIVLAPLFICVYAYSTEHELLGWWLKLTTGALLSPLISGALLGVTLGFMTSFSKAPVVGGLMEIIASIAGCWLAGAALKQLTGGAFHMGQAFMGIALATAEIALAAGAAVATGGASLGATGMGGMGAGGAGGMLGGIGGGMQGGMAGDMGGGMNGAMGGMSQALDHGLNWFGNIADVPQTRQRQMGYGYGYGGGGGGGGGGGQGEPDGLDQFVRSGDGMNAIRKRAETLGLGKAASDIFDNFDGGDQTHVSYAKNLVMQDTELRTGLHAFQLSQVTQPAMVTPQPAYDGHRDFAPGAGEY